MLPPLDPRNLGAFVCGNDDAHCIWLNSAKHTLNKKRNLSKGLEMLLTTYPDFQARMYHDRYSMNFDDDTGAKAWHLEFRDPPFDHLFIHPTLVEGAIELRVCKTPFLSMRIFDQPQNWQVLFQWLWKWGEDRQIARSIPQLDPQKIRALVNDQDIPERGGQIHGESLAGSRMEDDDSSVLAAKVALATGDMGEGIYKLLLLFQIFKPSLHWNKTSDQDTNMKPKLWYILFLISPFRSLRLQPSAVEGFVDLYGFNELIKSVPMTESPQSWQVLLEQLWKYGNERHIAKAKCKASRPRSGTKAKSQSKRQAAQQPLLHRVLRTVGFKNEQQSKLKPRQLENVAAGAADAKIMPTQRSPLRPADPNGQIGKVEQSRSMISGNGTKVIP